MLVIHYIEYHGSDGLSEYKCMGTINRLAPSGAVALDYDQRHLALYAALLEAEDAGADWRDAATSIMQIDVTERSAKACWRSHLDRARWIIGDGLNSALLEFDMGRFKL